MIIGVDAGALSITDDRLKVGVYRVVLNLLIELGKQDKKNTYRLYSFRPLEQGMMKLFGSRMTNIVLLQKGWFRLWLPLQLRKNPVDVFLGLSQTLPSSPGRTIGFIYDLGFLHYPHAYPDSLPHLKKQTEDLVKRADGLVTISHAVANDVRKQYNIPGSKITVSYPGVDSRFKPTGEKYTSQHPYFLFVGALKRGKNIPTLLKAFEKFRKKSKEQYELLLIGGDYWLDPAIEPSKGVKRLGFVPDSQLPNYYRGATALIMPSLWEGFCLPAVEAMASGCPVIASNAGALPEIVGDAGILVEAMDTDGFTNAMRAVLLDGSLKGKGKKRSRLFSWPAMAKAVLCEISG
ncbi:glycosyltransferase family 4 protein [Candidatus Gottesmanbacteria bacterium]|nr:glycosyltransferase family 4 protein [Candidatus Gottesmanbacteria bacterium]